MGLWGNQPRSSNRSNYKVTHKSLPTFWLIMVDLDNHVPPACKVKPPQLRRGFMSVPRVGLEPTHPEGYWILNPARLPISPPRHFAPYLIY